MNADSQKKLAMAIRVRDFSRAHPYTDPGQVALVTRFEDRIARAEQLDAQQREGNASVRASTTHRRELRRMIRRELLEHVVITARAASKEVPELATLFRVPRASARHQDFMTAARAMVATATDQKELLARHGLSAAVLDDLTAALAEYDSAVLQANSGRSAHVGARADIAAVMREIMELVDQLDGINRYRFRTDAEQLAAWKSARDLPWGPAPVPDQAEGQGGEPAAIAPAA
jgi:hypothetical protein